MKTISRIIWITGDTLLRRYALITGFLVWSIACISFASMSGEKGRIIELSGTLITGGVECQLFQTDSGEKYTLIGDLNGFKDGDRVSMSGSVVEISHCMQETTIMIRTISPLPQPDHQ